MHFQAKVNHIYLKKPQRGAFSAVFLTMVNYIYLKSPFLKLYLSFFVSFKILFNMHKIRTPFSTFMTKSGVFRHFFAFSPFYTHRVPLFWAKVQKNRPGHCRLPQFTIRKKNHACLTSYAKRQCFEGKNEKRKKTKKAEKAKAISTPRYCIMKNE